MRVLTILTCCLYRNTFWAYAKVKTTESGTKGFFSRTLVSGRRKPAEQAHSAVKSLSDSFSSTELRNSLQGPCHTVETSVLREYLEHSENNVTPPPTAGEQGCAVEHVPTPETEEMLVARH